MVTSVATFVRDVYRQRDGVRGVYSGKEVSVEFGMVCVCTRKEERVGKGMEEGERFV